ncbi:MAG: glycosyltransferase [Desulfobacteraceae bacterium]|nr:glycosyltransferase [Desulfobacteraceae bacterium]
MKKEEAPPMVSVIIPTHNRGWILPEAVDSVLNQTCREFELIVVDDGSTDDTARILTGYGTDISIIHQENRGVSAARNRGIHSSRGEYIAFLDSDDLWLPEKLAVQLAYFNDHPQYHICQTEEIWIRKGVRVNPKKRHKKLSGMIFEKCLPLCLVSPSAVMMRHSLFDDIGVFDESLPACEDYDLWLRTTWKYPVGLIETPLIIKRGGHDDQLSGMPELDKFRIQALLKALESPNLDAGQTRAAAAVLAEKCKIYAAGCRKHGRPDQADGYLSLAEKYMKP